MYWHSLGIWRETEPKIEVFALGDKSQSCDKSPTCLLLDKTFKYVAFGETAQTMAQDIDKNSTNNYYDNFKIRLSELNFGSDP